MVSEHRIWFTLPRHCFKQDFHVIVVDFQPEEEIIKNGCILSIIYFLLSYIITLFSTYKLLDNVIRDTTLKLIYNKLIYSNTIRIFIWRTNYVMIIIRLDYISASYFNNISSILRDTVFVNEWPSQVTIL